MKTVPCPARGSRMKRSGRTSAGGQRRRRPCCGASETARHDTTAARLRELLGWLLSKDAQASMPGRGRSFRRRVGELWGIWPVPRLTGEARRVVFAGGICLSGDLVVLMACADEHVLSWHMAQAETSRAREAPPAPMPAPDVAVTDGGAGLASAVGSAWPETRAQRRVFHALCQVGGHTAARPRLQAGVEPYGLAGELPHIESPRQAEWRLERHMQWCELWADFLEEGSWRDGGLELARVRLRKARGPCRPPTTRWRVA